MTADSDCRFCADPRTALSLASDLNELRLKQSIIWGEFELSDLELNKKGRARMILPLETHLLLSHCYFT
jgi:hypothetical protein